MGASSLPLKKKIAFTIFLCFCFIIFIELVLRAVFSIQIGPRVFLYGTPFSRHQVTFDPKGVDQRKTLDQGTVVAHENKRDGYTKYFPNQVLTDRDEFGNRFNTSVNALGFRGKPFSQAKSADVIRVVTLGASSTFGFHDRDDETYPFYMERMLNDALRARTGQGHDGEARSVKAFEVINLGIPHLTSDQIYSLLVNEGLPLKPDFVTFYEGINDAVPQVDSENLTGTTKRSIKSIPFAATVFRELRYRLLSFALVGSMITKYRMEYSKEEIDTFSREKKARFLGNLEKISDACKKNQSRLIVVSQQATTLEENREKLRGMTYAQEQALASARLASTGRLSALDTDFILQGDLMAAEREWVEKNSVLYLDAIRGVDSARHNLVTWVHLNAAGNRILASLLTREILEQVFGKNGSTAQRQ